MKWTPSRSLRLILLATVGIYFLTAKGHVEIIDTDYSLRTAQAIVKDATLLIEPPDPDVVAKGAAVVIDGKIYSKYGVGLVILFLPIVLAAKLLAFLPGPEESRILGFFISFYNIPFAIGALCFLHRICTHLGATSNRANLAVLALGIGTFFWKYTVTDFSEVTQLCFLLGTTFFLFRDQNRDVFKASALFSCLLMMKLVNVLLWGPLALYLLMRHGMGKAGLGQVLRFASIVFLAGLGLLLYNHLRFGSPFATGYEGTGIGFNLDNFKRDFIQYFFSPQRGLFAFNPILLAALAFWPGFIRSHRKEATCLLAIIVLWFLLMSAWVSYQGGWAWGNRLLIMTVPLLLIPFSLVRLDKPWQAVCVTGLFLVSVYIQLIAVFQHTQEYFVILRDIELKPETKSLMPPQLPGNAILFHQKLSGRSGEYPYRLFLGSSIPVEAGKKVVSTREYESYQGLHVWPFHLAAFMKQPILRWLMLAFPPLFFFLLYQFHRELRQARDAPNQTCS